MIPSGTTEKGMDDVMSGEKKKEDTFDGKVRYCWEINALRLISSLQNSSHCYCFYVRIN